MIRKLKLGASVTSFIVAVSAVTVLLIHSGNEAYNNSASDQIRQSIFCRALRQMSASPPHICSPCQ
ncbi:MAG: hypothetical protein CMO26_20875 [Thiotrichales bacterium]|nr:hypothetical protein [Thiotrichales bacterium]